MGFLLELDGINESGWCMGY